MGSRGRGAYVQSVLHVPRTSLVLHAAINKEIALTQELEIVRTELDAYKKENALLRKDLAVVRKELDAYQKSEPETTLLRKDLEVVRKELDAYKKEYKLLRQELEDDFVFVS